MGAAGTYFVTASLSGCTSAPASADVVVNQTPVITSANSNSPVCSGNTLNFNASTSFTGTVNWSWTGPNSFSSNLEDPAISNSTTAASGTYTVRVTNNTGSCASLQSTVNVIVNPTPVITSVTPVDPATCTGQGSLLISGLLSNTSYTINYTFNTASQSINATSNGSGQLSLPAIAGTYDNISVASLGCNSNSMGPYVIVDPTPPATPVISAISPLCAGASLNLNASTTSGIATYSWSGPGGYSSNMQNPVINPATVANSGTYSVTATIAGCTSAPATVNAVVNATPVLPNVNSNSPVCTDSTLNLSASTSFTGAVTWQWTGPNGFNSDQQNPVINNSTTANAGNYSVTATTGNCISPAATVPVTIIQTPVVGGVSSVNPSACASATGSISLNGLSPNTLYMVTYTYGGNTISITIQSDGAGSVNINNLQAGTYTNIIITGAGCKSLPVTSVTLTDPNPPATPEAFSNSPVCNGQTINLSATTSTAGPVSYSWTGPSGFTSPLQNPAIANATPAEAGWYYVSVTLNSCQSLRDSVLVVVNTLAALPGVASPVEYCIGTTATALTANSLPSHTLNWYTVAFGGTPLPSAPVPSTAIAGTTTYYVSQSTPQGCEGSRSAIDVIIHPDAMAVFNPLSPSGCPPFTIDNANINLQQFPDNNSVYNWYANNVFIGAGIVFPGYTINDENDSVLIKLVTTSLFGCKQDSSAKWFYTYKLPHPSFIKDISSGCGPLTVQFTNTTPFINDFTYDWDFGNGQTSSDVQPGPVMFVPNPLYGDTTYVFSLQIQTVCQTVTYKDSVLVQSKPKALFTPSRTTGCSPMVVTFTNTSLGLNNTYTWDMGDGTTQTTTGNSPVTHTYNSGIIDTFYIKLVAVNNCGIDSITYDIIVSPNNIGLNFQVNGTQQSGCAPHAVAFINNTTGAGSFRWNFGDGNVLSTTRGIDTVYHTYVSAGSYQVSLQALNSCTDTTAVKTINVFEKPVSNINAPNFNPCIGQSVQFSNNSTGANSYLWQFGDGNTSTLVNPSHAYAAAGAYIVTLIVYNTNPGGTICTDTSRRNISVASTLPGTIEISPLTGTCVPFTVTFINRNRPSASVQWDFGDGNTASGDSVVHTYNSAGVFTVTCIVLSPGGCTYNSSAVVTVTGPSGTLNYAANTCFPDGIRFDVNGNNTTRYNWDFGDGQTQVTTTSTVFHNYTSPGTYQPSVVLTNGGSCSFSITGATPVKVDKVEAGFRTAETYSCGSTLVTFTDTSFAFFGIASTLWNFGDGNTGTGSIVSHSYQASGTYPVTITITGISGCTKSITRNITVTVNAIPNASVSAPLTSCGNRNIVFTANISSADPVNTNLWQLSNGATGSGNSFEYYFDQPGNYTIRLITQTINGCSDTATHSLTVLPVPYIAASGGTTICLGNTAQLNASGASTWQWTPSDGLSCLDCPDPVATPLVTTPYIVTGISSNGCTDTATVVVTVIQPMSITTSADDSICIGQSINLMASGAASYAWSPAAGLNSTTSATPTANPRVTTTYRVVGYDGHNCFTDTAYIIIGVGQYPTVDLGPDKTYSTGSEIPLATSVTNGPVASWAWTPSADLSCSDCALPVATIRKNITYIVNILTEYGCPASDTISFKTFCEDAQVFIPNAFTPDNDGINDVLMVRGKGISSVKYFRIYNRWGELIFERSNFSPNQPSYGWNGKVRGVVGPPDVFVYTAEVVCDNGTSYTYKGNTSIIR